MMSLSEQLLEFKTKLAEGKMLELPCAEGTTIYTIEVDSSCCYSCYEYCGILDSGWCKRDYSAFPKISPLVEDAALCSKQKLIVVEKTFHVKDYFNCDYLKNGLNRTWWLTKDAALSAIKHYTGEDMQ